MTMEGLLDWLETNDLTFSYNNKEYGIFPMVIDENNPARNEIIAGELGNDNSGDLVCKSYEELFKKWNIQGKSLEEIVHDIEVL